ncbi:hypothetical protein Tco_1003135 [Tanacetum coccineum]|uniref:Uncharacterized protein n=1 Tax=Tanacetum coccineum TaxID=301880 RepID=A0ABQ5FAJ9_9ASTR
MNVSPIPTTRIDKDHPKDQIIGDFNSAIQTRRMTKIFDEHAMFDEIQAKMDVDHELAVRVTHEEQEKYTIEERATLLAEYFERKKKQMAAERAKEIRNKPPTRAQVRNRMITYLKHMEDGSHIKKAGKRIKRIIDSTSKQKSPKKSKVIKEQESAKSNEEAAVDYEQEKEELRMWLANLGSVDMEDIHIYKIIRADRNTSYHKTFSSMLRRFDRQDLMDLHRLVMKRFEDNTPEVHSLLMDGTLTCFNMLVEKRYPLIKEMLKKMLNWKLEAEAESTMAFELLKFIKRGLLGIMDFYNLVLLIQLDTAGDGLWYPRDSPFDLEAFSDSDYTGASIDRKSTIRAEYVAANCCGQVLWIQNQMLDYGFNFMNTKIYIDNESTIFIVNNPVFHSKTKHIEIRHHFIRDSHEKRLIQVIKIHTDHNVADFLTKAFDVSRFNFLVAGIDKKEFAIPGQTATGNEFSNPLMAGSLPKTISAKVSTASTNLVLLD